MSMVLSRMALMLGALLACLRALMLAPNEPVVWLLAGITGMLLLLWIELREKSER